MKPTRRIRRTALHWEQLINEHNDSGLTATAFCQQRDIAYQSFMKWRRRTQDAASEPVPTPSIRSSSSTLPAFIELTSPVRPPASAPSPWLVELDLGNGLQLRIARRD